MSKATATTNSKGEQGNVDKAVGYCEELIAYYHKCRAYHRNAWTTSQLLTIALSAVTPILILAKVSPIVSAIPPAIASITAGFSVFGWRENWAIHKFTEEALQTELIAFELGVTEHYNNDQALNNFIERINKLHLRQIEEWQKVTIKDINRTDSTKKSDKDKLVSLPESNE